MYIGVIYLLPDGTFVLSGPTVESAKGWTIRYARSAPAIQRVIKDLRSASPQEVLRPRIAELEAEAVELLEKRQRLPDVLYEGAQGEPGYWLHAFLCKMRVFEAESDLDRIREHAREKQWCVMASPPGRGFGLAAWTTGDTPETAIFFSRSQGLDIIQGVPRHPLSEKELATKRVEDYVLPKTTNVPVVRFSGDAALIITEAMRLGMLGG